MASSREAGPLAAGAAEQVRGRRHHVCINSLSNDFTTTSFAMLRERGCFQEIGKRGVWSSQRQAASVPSVQLEASLAELNEEMATLAASSPAPPETQRDLVSELGRSMQ